MRSTSHRLTAGVVGIASLGLAAPMSVASASDDATQFAPLYKAQAKSAIANDYIVVLKPTVSASAVDQVAAAAGAHGAQVAYTYRSALRGFNATMDNATLSAVRANPLVAYVESNAHVSAEFVSQPPGTQPDPTWGLDRIDQRDRPFDMSYSWDADGSGVTAYIIDTGVYVEHNDFGGRAGNGYDFVRDDPIANDCAGHGTHVAGTIGSTTYGVAKEVTLVGVRVLNCHARGNWARVVQGIDWVVANHDGPSVINMSLGGPPRRALDQAVTGAVSLGVVVVAAAGNDGADACDVSPARARAAITTGASAPTDAVAGFSNQGKCVDIFAPGVGVRSTYIGSPDADATLTGTSMAAPHVAGVAALYLSAHPDAGPDAVRRAIRMQATTDRLKLLGPGSPDMLLYSSID